MADYKECKFYTGDGKCSHEDAPEPYKSNCIGREACNAHEDSIELQAKLMEDMIYKKGYKAGIQKAVEFTHPLLEKIEGFVLGIEGDWTDPRYECRKIYEVIKEWQAFKESIDKEGK